MPAPARPHFDPSFVAPGPRRDARFTVVDQYMDCTNYEEDDPRFLIEFFHRQMNEELNGVENAARSLADFPDADWGVRMSIARQCADEARHVQMFQRIFESRGGKIGATPVMNFQFRIITNINNLVGRLAVQNRSFEAEGVDAVEPEIAKAKQNGDFELADLFDAQLADEICHVRFANQYILDMAKREPRSVMQVARAMSYGAKAFEQVMGEEVIGARKYSTNEQGRLDAGFTPQEVEYATGQRPKK